VGQDFTDHDYWVLGDIFNYNFYTVFDAENETPRVGLAVQNGGVVGGTLKPGAVPDPTNNSLTNIMVGIVLFLLAILLCFIVARWRKNSKKESAQSRVDLFERKKRLEEEGEYTVMSEGSEENGEKEAPLIDTADNQSNFRTEEAGNNFDNEGEGQQTDSLFN